MTARAGSVALGAALAAFLAAFLVAAPCAAQHELLQLMADDGEEEDHFVAVSICGELAVVGALEDDEQGWRAGSAYVFDAPSGRQLHKLLPLDGYKEDHFGCCVGLDGRLAVICAHWDDDLGSMSGSAYVFDVESGAQLHKLLAPDGNAGDFFGGSVAICGHRAVIGASSDDDHGSGSGSAYVFDVVAGKLLYKLTAFDGDVWDMFGSGVAIDEDYVAVGSPHDDDMGPQSGSVYVFDADRGLLVTKVLAPDGVAGDGFGGPVAVDGDRLLVGAAGDNYPGDDAGGAYLFDLPSGQMLFKWKASDKAPEDHFGSSVALEGERAIIAANANDDWGSWSGSAYVFDTVSGVELYKLLASDGETDDRFGEDVAISGGRVLIGATRGNGVEVDSGKAYLFSIPPGWGETYCFGDGSGAGCPCGNHGGAGRGCANGAGVGAHLSASGDPTIGADTVVLCATQCPPGVPGLLFSGPGPLAGAPFGDGLRCVGGPLIRIGVVFADPWGTAMSTSTLSIREGLLGGELRHYQLWYRDTAGPCGQGFNLTNAYRIQW